MSGCVWNRPQRGVNLYVCVCYSKCEDSILLQLHAVDLCGMAVYKGVKLFGEFMDDETGNASTTKFPQWQPKVRIARMKNFPESAKFLSPSSQELQEDLEQTVSSASSPEAAQKLIRVHEDADLDAAGDLLLFLAEPLSSQVHGLRKGSAVWAYLHEQRLHNRGMVAEDEYRRLGPQESEFVAAYCRRLSSCRKGTSRVDSGKACRAG
jgi:hypothetical protein